MDQILIYSYFGILAVGIGFVLFVIVPTFIGEFYNFKQRIKFCRALKDAYALKPPEWKHVEILSRRYFLDKKHLKIALERVLEECLTNNDEHSDDKIAYIDSLLTEIERSEPFEGIPDRLKVHLEHVREKVGDKDFDLKPLSNELRDLTVARSKERKFDKVITVASFLVGVIGTVFGGISYFEDTPNVNEIAAVHAEKSPNK